MVTRNIFEHNRFQRYLNPWPIRDVLQFMTHLFADIYKNMVLWYVVRLELQVSFHESFRKKIFVLCLKENLVDGDICLHCRRHLLSKDTLGRLNQHSVKNKPSSFFSQWEKLSIHNFLSRKYRYAIPFVDCEGLLTGFWRCHPRLVSCSSWTFMLTDIRMNNLRYLMVKVHNNSLCRNRNKMTKIPSTTKQLCLLDKRLVLNLAQIKWCRESVYQQFC